MIQVPFSEPLDEAWTSWRSRATRATKTLTDNFKSGASYRIREALYKEMRQVFLDAYHGKCAYCEAKIILDQHSGDVEHYRPKRRVTDDNGKPVTLASSQGPPRQHPGYPWLAYDPHNLLPSCIGCNRPGTTRQGKRVGKWDRFPVSRFRASAPGEEGREKPLLLHPAFDNPEDHLGLDISTGVIYGKTKRGATTIELLNLNREGLPEERRKTYLSVAAIIGSARTETDNPARLREWLELLAKYQAGIEAYSWPGRLALTNANPGPAT